MLKREMNPTGGIAVNAKRAFEASIARIQRPEKLTAAQLPIAVRRRAPENGGEATEKRALTDAARALAQLWKISPALVR